MASFGERLKHEREQRGVTLDDISVATKISTRMLDALEHDHLSTTAEMEILRSRMVIGQAVDATLLYVDAAPRYLPRDIPQLHH